MQELAVAGKAVEVEAQVGLLDPVADLLDRGVVVNDVTGQPLGELLPELVVPVQDVLRQRRQRLAVDLHDDAKGRQIRIHPVQRKAFLDVELVLGVMVEDDLGEQAVDVHHGDLAGDLHPVVNDLHVLARLELVELHAPLGVGHVFLEAALGVVRRGRVDLAVRINPAQALGDFLRVSRLQQQPVQPDAGPALRVLLDEIRQVFRKLPPA